MPSDETKPVDTLVRQTKSSPYTHWVLKNGELPTRRTCGEKRWGSHGGRRGSSSSAVPDPPWYSMSDVTPFDVQPAQFVSAIGSMEKQMRSSAGSGTQVISGAVWEISWPFGRRRDDNRPMGYHSRDDWVARNPEPAERFLRSLDAAEKYHYPPCRTGNSEETY